MEYAVLRGIHANHKLAMSMVITVCLWSTNNYLSSYSHTMWGEQLFFIGRNVQKLNMTCHSRAYSLKLINCNIEHWSMNIYTVCCCLLKKTTCMNTLLQQKDPIFLHTRSVYYYLKLSSELKKDGWQNDLHADSLRFL